MEPKEFDFRIYDRKNKWYITEDKREGIALGIVKCVSTYAVLYFMDERSIDYYTDIEIELFTGYLDKTGKKIYENDILEVKGVIGVVKFINGAFKLVALRGNFNGRGTRKLSKCSLIRVGIVKGNAHESDFIH